MRQVTEQRSDSYERQVDRALREQTGVAYSLIREDLESSPLAEIRFADAVSHDLDPAEFAERVKRNFGLLDRDMPDAIPYNRRLAALIEFAASKPEWSVGHDGLYRETSEGIERLAPGRAADSKHYGFAASVSSWGSLRTVGGRAVEVEGEFEPVTGAIDIGDAVDSLEASYDRGMRM